MRSVHILYHGLKSSFYEPQADYKKRNYRMSEFWGSRYAPKYDIFGETKYWLGECVQ